MLNQRLATFENRGESLCIMTRRKSKLALKHGIKSVDQKHKAVTASLPPRYRTDLRVRQKKVFGTALLSNTHEAVIILRSITQQSNECQPMSTHFAFDNYSLRWCPKPDSTCLPPQRNSDGRCAGSLPVSSYTRPATRNASSMKIKHINQSVNYNKYRGCSPSA